MKGKITKKGISIRMLAIAILSLLLFVPLISVAATGAVAPTSGGLGLGIFAGCAVYGVASTVLGGSAPLFNWCALVAGIAYFATPITIALIILIYELILRLDLAGAAGSVINRILARGSAKNTGVSILPRSIDVSTDHIVEQDLFKLDQPLNMFLNINRAFLYMAFFLSFVTIWPINYVFSFPSSAYIAIFTFINTFITVVEVLFLPTLLLLFAPLNIYVDVVVDLINLFTK